MSLNHIPLSLSITPPCTLDKNPQYRIAGVKGAWTFNEETGAPLDYSGNGNTGIISGATRIDTLYGKGLRCDGVDDFVRLPIPSGIYGNEVTIHQRLFMHKPKVNADWSKFSSIGLRDSLSTTYLTIYTSNAVDFDLVQLSSRARLPDDSTMIFYWNLTMMTNKWLDLKIRWKERTITVYVDGEFLQSVSNPKPVNIPDDWVTVFDDPLTGIQYRQFVLGSNESYFQMMKVDYDFFSIYNFAFSDAQMADLNYKDPTVEAGKAYVRGRFAEGNGLNKRIDKLKGD